MKLNAQNDPAVRNFEDWVRRELYGPDDPRARRGERTEDKDPDSSSTDPATQPAEDMDIPLDKVR